MINVSGTNGVDNEKIGDRSNYRALTPATAMAGHPSVFHHSQIDLSATPGNTNTVSHMNNMRVTKNDTNNAYDTPTGAAPMSAYPTSSPFGEIDLPSMNDYTNNTKNTHRLKTMGTATNGTKVNHHATATPQMRTYPTSFRSSHIDSRSTPNTNIMTNANDMDPTRNGHKRHFHAPTATLPIPTNRKVSFQSSDTGSSSYTPGNTNTTKKMNTINETKNSNRGSCESTLAAPAIAGYPIAFRPGEIDLSSTPGHPGYSNNTSNLNRVNKMDNAKNGNKSSYHSSTAPPPVPTYPSASHSSEIDSSSTQTNAVRGVHPSSFHHEEIYLSSTPGYTNNTNNINSMSTMDMAKNGKKVNYHASTAAPPIASYPSAF